MNPHWQNNLPWNMNPLVNNTNIEQLDQHPLQIPHNNATPFDQSPQLPPHHHHRPIRHRTHQTHHLDQQLGQQLSHFWARQYQESHQAVDFKTHCLPLARIKKIMKADEDVRMISAEAPVVFARACEMFILDLTMRAWAHAEQGKRRTLQKTDVVAAASKSEMFDFLVDIVPREHRVLAPAVSGGQDVCHHPVCGDHHGHDHDDDHGGMMMMVSGMGMGMGMPMEGNVQMGHQGFVNGSSGEEGWSYIPPPPLPPPHSDF